MDFGMIFAVVFPPGNRAVPHGEVVVGMRRFLWQDRYLSIERGPGYDEQVRLQATIPEHVLVPSRAYVAVVNVWSKGTGWRMIPALEAMSAEDLVADDWDFIVDCDLAPLRSIIETPVPPELEAFR